MDRARSFARSARGPAVLFVVVIILVVALTVLWNFVLSRDYIRMRDLAAQAAKEEGAAFHWTFIAIGSTLFVAIIVLTSILGAQLFAEIRLNQRQSVFIATVTHELNSPLASIKLYAQTLRNPDIPAEERARFLATMLADIERLRTLIANVLRAAHVEAGQLDLLPEPIDLREWLEDYVEDVARSLRERASGSSIRLAGAPPGATPFRPVVEIDGPVFRHVLDNLVDNALKYARPGGARVELRLEPGQGPRLARDRRAWAALDVSDDGVGIPRADLKRIFERFRRIEKGDRVRQGTGLGLNIARSLVELHGGAIAAHSEGEGRGATFRIELPLQEAAAPGAPPGGATSDRGDG